MKNYLLGILITASLGLNGCYPNEVTKTEEFDLVLTNHVENLTIIGTNYYLSDSVTSGDGQGGGERLGGSLERTITASIAQNLNELGYTKVGSPELSDYVVRPVVTTQDFYSGGAFFGRC